VSIDTLGVDAYQLTTLVAHAEAGRLAQQVAMTFFFRKMPKNRGYVVSAGLRSILDHARAMKISSDELDALSRYPLLAAAFARHPEVIRALAELDGFDGEIDALPEGTLAWAGPGLRSDGKPFSINGTPVTLYVPLMQVRTDMVRAKLIETPWLSRINHAAMVASKAARIVDAAAGKPVIEFGGRRTHPAAAIDAAHAAYLAGCIGTSNVAAHLARGIPMFGTMDHFAVQAAEREGVSCSESERAIFASFTRAFPNAAILLVDTYDTERGIENAVLATEGKLTGIRLDSNVTPETVARARQILDGLNAQHVKIWVSDGMTEWRVASMANLADGFGVGENITCSPDAATGIGAVAKIVVNGYGRVTMKVAKGTGKATLPGMLGVYRFSDHDLLTLSSESAPPGGKPLLQPVWRGLAEVANLPSIEESRASVRSQIQALPAELRGLEAPAVPRPIVASDALVAKVEELVKEACP
jgi:nicotinate phosphoribosyltransferase